MKRLFITISTILIALHSAIAYENPIEVGSVRWGRDLDQALKISKKTNKPVLVLFQEVPGCIGCQNFGKTVLSYPLLVEAIETEFLPVLVYNNRGRKDKAVLDRFNEPSWNYQVLRFLNEKGQDIIPRKDRIWSIGGVAIRLIEALKASKRRIPKYLEVIAEEHETKHHAVSAFAMHCFWTGEMKLGGIDGVVATEAGWLEGHEVTRVIYNKEKISMKKLAEKAQKLGLATKVYTSGNEAKDLKTFSIGQFDSRYRKAKASDQKKQIESWRAIQKVPGITDMQKTKINAFIHIDKTKALEWLSPRQRKALKRID